MSRRRATALGAGISLLLLAGAVATANAQDVPEPYTTVEEQATENDLDTDFTPVAKQSDFWTLVHGAKFGKTDVVEHSATSFDSDLFGVSFVDTSTGLAGGSACATTPIQQPGEQDADFGQRVAQCNSPTGEPTARVPVLYRYLVPEDGTDPRWERLELQNSSKPGYIGSIAWIDFNTAVIVGGTGEYPRRELGWTDRDQYGRQNNIADPTALNKADVAGKARAWLYDAEADVAHELDLSELTVDGPNRAGMRGLTAVDCFRDPYPGQRVIFVSSTYRLEPDPNPPIELCFAGALGQIWEWRDGKFTGKRVDAQSAAADLTNPNLFRFRVRDIEFGDVDPPRAFAVTAGCCAESSLDHLPRTLSYQERDSNGTVELRRWSAQGGQGPNADQAAPDSFYSVITSRSGFAPHTTAASTTIATPGGPEGQASSEPPSRLPGDSLPPLGTSRFLAADGDVWRQSKVGPFSTEARPGADGIADWFVGELRSTKVFGLGAQGLLATAGRKPTLARLAGLGVASEVVNLGAGLTSFSTNPAGATVEIRPTAEEIAGGWEPFNDKKLDGYRRSPYYLLSSYTVNAIDLIGAEEDGWAVGDHGAILRLSAKAAQEASAANEPTPPKLGNPRREPIADRSIFPPTTTAFSAGMVPPLGEETVRLDTPVMVPSNSLAGSGPSPGSIVDIVMSRDGSEGWAIGNDDRGPVFTYYDGSSWTRCDPVGIEGVVKPDPACKAMAPLRGYHDSVGNFKTVRVGMATRIPLENDADPTNDDELEVVAIGQSDPQGKYTGPETNGKEVTAIVRYRNGRWRFEDPSGPGSLHTDFPWLFRHIAFVAPDEGWIAGQINSVTNFWRWDGARWIDCRLEPAPCGNSAGRLPQASTSEDEIRGLAVAGDRIYAYGLRAGAGSSTFTGVYRPYPLIVYRDPGEEWTDGSGPGGDRAGLDPSFSDPATTLTGRVETLTVAESPTGGFEGWAAGYFNSTAQAPRPELRSPPQSGLMRLEPSSGEGWQMFRSPGTFDDHMLGGVGVALGRPQNQTNKRLAVGYSAAIDPDATFIAQQGSDSRVFGFDSARQRFKQLTSGLPQGTSNVHLFGPPSPFGITDVMAPDAQGGFWGAIRMTGTHAVHYTDRLPKPVFEETANPFESQNTQIRAITGSPDGAVWVATTSDRLYRNTRGLGWEEIRVPGWEPGRVVTRASEATAIAIGPDGNGLAVGEGGRIADLSPEGVSLNAAAGRSCALRDPLPCGTSRNLFAVDIAPDGSALIAGDRLSLLWRPPAGDFRTVSRPPLVSSARIEAVAYPSPGRAYLATDTGAVLRGDMPQKGEWRWRVENGVVHKGQRTVNSIDRQGLPLPLRDLAVDAAGHGYAVGDRGLILERTEENGWQRLPTRYAEDLTAVELAAGAGGGALIGGENGLILTGVGSRFEVANQPDFPVGAGGPVLGFAYLPGSSERSVDAWAAIGRTLGGIGDSQLLRYRSDPQDEALDPSAFTDALDDAGLREGELTIAAFGKSDCDRSEASLCPEMSGTTTTNEVINQRIIDELAVRRDSGALDLAILSGDAIDAAGRPGSSLADRGVGNTQVAGPVKHRRYVEFVADQFMDERIPLFGAIGGQDLTENFACDTEGGCESTKPLANAGENLAWREAFSGRPAPWGNGEEMRASDGEVLLSPTPGADDNAIGLEDVEISIDTGGIAPDRLAIGGAATHYALEVERDSHRVARIVFVDTSLKSLAASDPLQQPQEIGSQLRFLERMICFRGQMSSMGDPCTREPGQAAVVVSNTPTYSYGPGALTHTASDASVFEAMMLRHDVDLVVSGALGYSGLYYTLAPGIHTPCPGGKHPDGPPNALPSCADGSAPELGALEEHGATEPTRLLDEQGLTGAVPTLIAASAGGKFGPDGRQGSDGAAGQWHGYSVARIAPKGHVAIEQRPILDWIGIEADEHTLAAKQRLTLNGYGRSPISTSAEGMQVRAFHYEIANPAITHRYDLVIADPSSPWVPCEAANPACRSLRESLVGPGSLDSAPASSGEGEAPNCDPYLCLPERIGTIDRSTGEVEAGNGKYPDTFAVAMLSVGEKVATWPLAFKRSPAFVVAPAGLPAPAPQAPSAVPSPPQPPPPPQPPAANVPHASAPTIPALPLVSPLAPSAPPEPQPPAPPVPPPPSEAPAPLSLALAPPGIAIATPTAVIQPPTPPVNPAPPGGARREARQRQAAAQKSGADSDKDSVGEESMNSGDLANAPYSPSGANMTRHEPAPERRYEFARHERNRPEPSFTALSRAESGGNAQAVLYTGGATLLAAILALGWTYGRPTPRRRTPELPAPAFAKLTRRRG